MTSPRSRFPSTFAFCTDHLGLTNGSAYRRTTAASLVARFPIVADYLADGRLNLTALVEILDRAAGRSEEDGPGSYPTLEVRMERATGA